MLLRRISEHVKQQNWFAVGIDFAIVVIGVYIGIQVSNWNEERVNRTIAAGHLAEIAEDLKAHLNFHNDLHDSAVARIAAADYLLAEAGHPEPPKSLRLAISEFAMPELPDVREEDTPHLLGWLNLVRITVSSRNGYESLINSGNMRLLGNADLARQVQGYYGRYDDLMDTQQLFRQFRNDGVRAGYVFGLSAFDVRPIEEVVAIVREEEAYAAYVRTVREWAIAHASLLSGLCTETRELLDAIEAELGTRSHSTSRPELRGCG